MKEALLGASVLLTAIGSALGVCLQVRVVVSLEEGATMPRYAGAVVGIVVGVLVARYARARTGQWWAILLRMVLFVVLGYPLLGALLYVLAYPLENREYAHLIAGHLAIFGPIWWLPLLVGLALVERKRAAPDEGTPTTAVTAKNSSRQE